MHLHDVLACALREELWSLIIVWKMENYQGTNHPTLGIWESSGTSMTGWVTEDSSCITSTWGGLRPSERSIAPGEAWAKRRAAVVQESSEESLSPEPEAFPSWLHNEHEGLPEIENFHCEQIGWFVTTLFLDKKEGPQKVHFCRASLLVFLCSLENRIQFLGSKLMHMIRFWRLEWYLGIDAGIVIC